MSSIHQAEEMPMDMSPDSGINELQGLSPEEQERQKQEWQQELIKQSRNDQPIDNGAVPEFELGPADNGAVPEFELGPADNGAVPEFELGPADNGAIPEFELVPADNVAIPEFELVPADNGAIPEFELGPFDDISPTLMAARFDIAIISPKLSKTRLRSRARKTSRPALPPKEQAVIGVLAGLPELFIPTKTTQHDDPKLGEITNALAQGEVRQN
uniref:Uncharacterized protein n=1 Tax=Timema bartmani TaxID=61472 RepID=A0A7R9EW70_9NEOP|nr:unnamed protein product [Timema bartmani]